MGTIMGTAMTAARRSIHTTEEARLNDIGDAICCALLVVAGLSGYVWLYLAVMSFLPPR
jgi:hypothetical protein